MVILLLLAVLARGYTVAEVDRGQACIKLCVVYHSVGDSRVYQVLKRRPDLDATALEDRIMMDMFMHCWQHVAKEDLDDLSKVNSREGIERFSHYLEFSESKYMQESVDLEVTREERELRTMSLAPGSRHRLADRQRTLEALKVAEEARRRKEL